MARKCPCVRYPGGPSASLYGKARAAKERPHEWYLLGDQMNLCCVLARRRRYGDDYRQLVLPRSRRTLCLHRLSSTNSSPLAHSPRSAHTGTVWRGCPDLPHLDVEDREGELCPVEADSGFGSSDAELVVGWCQAVQFLVIRLKLSVEDFREPLRVSL